MRRRELLINGQKFDPNGYDYVDLGLPSGTLWATCNIGAETETDYGVYFAWGETNGYTSSQIGSGSGLKFFEWQDYKWGNKGDGTAMTKYNSSDKLITLEPEDDAAHVNMGGDWRMPTSGECNELKKYCLWNKTQVNGVSGYTATRNNKHIFFPYAGYGSNGRYIENYPKYFTSTLNKSAVYEAHYLFMNMSYKSVDIYTSSRSWGFSIRAVISQT